MTKQDALYDFFSSFGLTAYEATNVPEDATLPYLTYTYADDDFYGNQAAIIVNLWYRTESNATPNDKVSDIADIVGRGGAMIPCDGGVIWMKKGSPFAQSIADSDPDIRRRYINLTAEFLTA